MSERSRPADGDEQQANAERLKVALRLGNEWYWELDEELRFVTFSGGAELADRRYVEQHIGHRRWEIAGLTPVSGDWGPHRADLMARRPFRDLVVKRTGVGDRPRYASLRGEPYFAADGRFRGYRGIATEVTERIEQEQALRESEARFRGIFEQAALGVGLRGVDGRWLQVNQKLCDILGYTREELLATTSVEITPPGERDDAIDHTQRIVSGEIASYSREKQYLHKNGTRVWVTVTVSVIKDAYGQPSHLITIVQDISKRKQAEQALAESEARFRDFAHASADWFWETDTESRFTMVADSVEQATGVPAAEHVGRRSEEMAAPGTDFGAAPWVSHLARIAHREPFRDFRYQRGEPDKQRWVSISGVPRFSATGEFLGYRGVSSDITERITAGRRVKEANELLAAAIEHLGEMIVLTNAADRIVVANRRFLEFNRAVAHFVAPGRKYDEHLRAGIALGMFPDAAGREEAWLAERMDHRHRPKGPIERRRQDGRWLQVEDHRLPDGGIISFGIEITDRKRAEEALRNINADLERRVAERTAALESAYRELESFSYSVSHDLRSPLGVIASFAGILARQEAGRISEDGMRLVTVIDESAQRMARLIDALLELMRVSRLTLARHPLDMTAVASTACRELKRGYPQARIEIGTLPAARGDEMLINQVYANLVGNALKFSSKTASPHVELGAEARDGAPVYFVRDNGAGFDMDHADKLFKPFERLHTDAEFQGAGIGLALVHLIVQRHGGRIWAEAAPGRGATFRFTLGAGVSNPAPG